MSTAPASSPDHTDRDAAQDALAPVLAELNGAAERIWLASAATCPGLSIEVLPELGSTNTELMARGRDQHDPALRTVDFPNAAVPWAIDLPVPLPRGEGLDLLIRHHPDPEL